MIEKKFRAWHKEHKKYFEVEGFYFPKESVIITGFVLVKLCLVIIEPYVGFDDRDGKGIYVGDLVKDYAGTRYEIIASKDGFRAKDLIGTLHSIFSITPAKIIGNIHDKE